MNKSFIVTLFSTLILSISVNAWAAPPSSVTYYQSEDFAVVGCSDYGDYHIRTSAETRITETTFFNQAGDDVRLRVSVHIVESIYYNSLNPDIYIQQGQNGVGENWQISLNLVTGAERYTGKPYRITLPGVGPLYIEAGHGSWDGVTFTFRGISIMPEAGTGSALCEALAP